LTTAGDITCEGNSVNAAIAAVNNLMTQYLGSVTTTNATATTVFTIPTSSGKSYLIETYYSAWNSTASASINNAAVGRYMEMYVNASGSVAYITTLMNNTNTGSGLSAITTERTVSGSNILVQVTGVASTSIVWNVHCEVLVS